MSKRSASDENGESGSKRARDTNAVGNTAQATGIPGEHCHDCGSTQIIKGTGEDYCAECGAVVEEMELTSDYRYETEDTERGTYIRAQAYVDSGDPVAVRFNSYWNRAQTSDAHRRISSVCRQLDITGLEARAQRIFDEWAQQLMRRHKPEVFGRYKKAREMASIYVAAHEANRVVNLVDLAHAEQISVYQIGRQLRQCAVLVEGIRCLPLDPVLRSETAVNRTCGYAHRCGRDADFRAQVLKLLGEHPMKKIAQGFPELLLEFLAANEQHRGRLIELTGQVMAFHGKFEPLTGTNPNMLVSCAVTLAIEHQYVASDRTQLGQLKFSHRLAIIRLVALANKVGQFTLKRHIEAMHKTLREGSKTVPWLKDTRLSPGTLSLYMPDILQCCDHALTWLFSMESDSEADSSGLRAELEDAVVKLRRPPAFARAVERRELRARLLAEGAASEAGDFAQEAEVLRRLDSLGFDRNALLTLPLHSLHALEAMVTRQHIISDMDAQSLGPLDMTDEEIRLYLLPSAQDNEAEGAEGLGG